MREEIVKELQRLTEEKGVATVAQEAGVARDSIYRWLRGERSVMPLTLEKLLNTYPTIKAIICHDEESAQ